jgi:hypothetical protein
VTRSRRVFSGLCALLAWTALSSAVAAQPKTPTQSYVEYQAVLAEATKLREVLPYLSAPYRAMLESRPKEDQPVWLKRLKESAVTGLKVTKETLAGDKCTLEATGTSARGNAVTGKISLVKQGGAWKLDEEGWATH